MMKNNRWIKNLTILSEKDKPRVTQSDKKQSFDPKLELDVLYASVIKMQ